MPLMVGELLDLDLDGGAVTRADAGDRPAIQGRQVEVIPDHGMGLGIGVSHIAHDAVFERAPGSE